MHFHNQERAMPQPHFAISIFWVMRSLEDWEQRIGRNFALCAVLPCLVRIPSLFLLQERQMMKTFPHLLNVNEDPQLTGVLKHFIQAGTYLPLSTRTEGRQREEGQEALACWLWFVRSLTELSGTF